MRQVLAYVDLVVWSTTKTNGNIPPTAKDPESDLSQFEAKLAKSWQSLGGPLIRGLPTT